MPLRDMTLPFFGVMFSPLPFGYFRALPALERTRFSWAVRMAHVYVFALATAYLKVLRSVVKFVPVDVVDYFSRLKKPSEFLFHNEAVFVHIASTVGVGVSRGENLHILANLSPAPIPAGMIFAVHWWKSIFSHIGIVIHT